jgi:PAS domain S-box-containing protein
MAVHRNSTEYVDSRHSPPDPGAETPREGVTNGHSPLAALTTLAANEERYRLAIEAAQLGTWMWDVATDVATFDDRVRELLGLSDENARSRASIIETRIHPEDRERLNAALMRAANPSGDGRFQGEYRIARPDGIERWVLVFARMHFTANGEPRQAAQLIGTVLDITDQKRAQARERLLARLGADLLVAADESVALQEMADAAVVDLADWAVVDVIDADGRARRAAMAHADPAKMDIMRELVDRYPPDPAHPTLGREALATGRPHLYAQVDDALLNVLARDPDQARLARSIGARSAIAVPLRTREGPFGIAAFGSGRRSFTPDDLWVAEEIGRRASLAVENARLMTEAKRAQDAAEQAASRTARLQALSAALASALTPDDAMTESVREGILAVGADAGLLVLVDPTGTTLEVMDARGYDMSKIDRWRRFPLDANVPIADAVRSAEIIVIETDEERERRYPAIDGGLAVTYPASISVPLVSEGRSFGALGLSFHNPIRVTLEDRDLLLAVARQCAQAVRRAVLFDAEGLARASAEEAGRRLKFLADASAALASLDYETTLQHVAQLAVPSFADYVVIDLLDDAGAIRRVAYAHADPSRVPLLQQTARYYPVASHDAHPFRDALVKGEPILVAEVGEAWVRRLAPSPEHLAVVQALHPTSVIMAPLSARGHTLGLMTFAIAASGRRYGSADVSLAGEVAQRAAVAVDNARLYRQSELARREAEAASRAKGQFLAVMSHELRTPLNAILGYSELLEMGVHGPVSDAQREAMGRIRRSGQHLLALVNNVLNLERSEVDNRETEFATLSVAQLFDDASTLTWPQAEAKGVVLSVHAPPPELAVLGEREKAGQVLVNLLSNAVKFTPAGGRIDLGYEVTDDAVTIRVSDSGPGIPADSLSRIFEPFVQLDSGLTRRAEGAGLGLAISRRLARLMGGDLTVESEVGKGSRFSFSLVRVG